MKITEARRLFPLYPRHAIETRILFTRRSSGRLAGRWLLRPDNG
ncbi:hypothetical protein [Micromonospora sp. NPDC004704]